MGVDDTLRQQLLEIGEHTDDVMILEQQRKIKADAREAKAARMAAKGDLIAHVLLCVDVSSHCTCVVILFWHHTPCKARARQNQKQRLKQRVREPRERRPCQRNQSQHPGSTELSPTKPCPSKAKQPSPYASLAWLQQRVCRICFDCQRRQQTPAPTCKTQQQQEQQWTKTQPKLKHPGRSEDDNLMQLCMHIKPRS